MAVQGSGRLYLTGGLTKKQYSLLEYIVTRAWIGMGFTLDGLCRKFRWRSTHSPRRHLVALEKKGYITRLRRKTTIHWHTVVPILGIPVLRREVVPGPLLQDANISEIFRVGDIGLQEQPCAIKIEDDSLRSEGILRGDLVFCATGTLNNGQRSQLVLVSSAGSVGVKPGSEPLHTDEEVIGRVVAVFRRTV